MLFTHIRVKNIHIRPPGMCRNRKYLYRQHPDRRTGSSKASPLLLQGVPGGPLEYFLLLREGGTIIFILFFR